MTHQTNNPNNVKLNVLEERVCNMIKTNSTDHGEILKKIEEVSNKLDMYATKAELSKVREEFLPSKTIAYGLVSIIVIAVLGAIIKLVIR